MTRTLITVATYNERENLPQLVNEIFQFAPDVNILVIDDNSPDGTGQWCVDQARSEPRLHCLHRQGKLGLGSATICGMRYAIEHGYDQVLNMDADLSHPPKYLPALLGGMPELADGRPTDVMIGSRYVEGGQIDGWPWRRHLMSRAVNAYARTLLGLKAKDCSGAFRCYRTSVLKLLDFDAFLSHGYSFQEEVLFRIARLGAVIRETPITFVDRQRGSSKINIKEAVAAVFIVLQLGLGRLLGRPRNSKAAP
jgi:dolichol-phosphate mannosyltransferase